MRINIHIEDEIIQNLFDSVIGGPYSGWIKTFSANKDAKGNWTGSIQFDREQDDEATFKGCKNISNSVIKKGLKIMANEFPSRFCNLLDNNTDAVDADIFMQSLVFGREVYA